MFECLKSCFESKFSINEDTKVTYIVVRGLCICWAWCCSKGCFDGSLEAFVWG